MGQSFSRAVYPYRLEAVALWDAFRRKYLGKGGVGPGQPRAVGRPLVPETGDIDEDLYNASAADDIATVDRLIKAGAGTRRTPGARAGAARAHTTTRTALIASLWPSLVRRAHHAVQPQN